MLNFTFNMLQNMNEALSYFLIKNELSNKQNEAS